MHDDLHQISETEIRDWFIKHNTSGDTIIVQHLLYHQPAFDVHSYSAWLPDRLLDTLIAVTYRADDQEYWYTDWSNEVISAHRARPLHPRPQTLEERYPWLA